MRSRMLLLLAAAVVATACGLAVGVFVAPAWAETTTTTEEVEFAQIHPCTGELVEGDTKVHMVITTTENPDGSTHVRVHQRTHGQSLRGVVSGDEYVFNNGEDVITDDTIFGQTGRVVVRTEFIHRGEDQAFMEAPGLDDLHQRMVVTLTPLLPPTVESQRTECR